MLLKTVAALGAVLLTAPGAFAAQPYVTDDASVLAPGQCQFELGKQVNRGNHELWTLPACNLFANTEVTVGKSRFSENDGQASLYVLQGKGVWREFSAERFGIGWVAGVRGRSRTDEDLRRISSYYASLLVSRAFMNERLAAHLNAGFIADRDARTEPVTWAAGAEYSLSPRWKVIGEFSGDDRTRPLHQAGVRIGLVPDRFELDVTAGGQNGNRRGTRFWTIGVRMLTDPRR
jgi:opacity protein-like surface antigen